MLGALVFRGTTLDDCIVLYDAGWMFPASGHRVRFSVAPHCPHLLRIRHILCVCVLVWGFVNPEKNKQKEILNPNSPNAHKKHTKNHPQYIIQLEATRFTATHSIPGSPGIKPQMSAQAQSKGRLLCIPLKKAKQRQGKNNFHRQNLD